MAVQVDLNLLEFNLAIQTASLRMVSSGFQGLNHASTYKRNYMKRLMEEVAGACGEIGMGKLADRWFVPSLNTFHDKPDCLKNLEIRGTERADGSLIVRDNDATDRRYVLAVVDAPVVTIVGWIWGSDARKPEYLRNPHNYREAWFVPQKNLNAITRDIVLGWSKELTQITV